MGASKSEAWMEHARRRKPWLFLCFVIVCLSPYAWALSLIISRDSNAHLLQGITHNIIFSTLAFLATLLFIPRAHKHLKIYGYDINKKGTSLGRVRVPESMGSVCGIIYLVTTMLFYPSHSYPSLTLFEYSASLIAISSMLLLGFIDDKWELGWMTKILLPFFPAMLLVMSYSGGTSILIPWLNTLLDLGWLYKVCIVIGVVFSTNAINIHAGINGLEAGQTVVMSCSILACNAFKLALSSSLDHSTLQAHTFSIYLTQPLVAVSLGLLAFNWFPSSVFVGDSFTYFSGMTIAVAATFGHSFDALFFLMLPQFFNTVYSLPQLLKIVPCPRHRLPTFDAQSGLLFGKKDMNLVNLFLRVFGPCSEHRLFVRLMMLQAVCCGGTILYTYAQGKWW